MPNTPRAMIRDAFDPRAFLCRNGAGKTIERFAKNQKVFGQGDIADAVFFIQKGKVKITVLSEQGKEAVVGIFAAGQFFGETCLEGEELRASTGQALEECLITSITKTEMLATLAEEPNFSAFFIGHLLSRNRRIEDDLVDQLFNPAKDGWRGCSCCSPISARARSPFRSRSARRRWRK